MSSYKTELQVSCLGPKASTACKSAALGCSVSLRLFSSFALVSEVCASYESSVMMLQEQDRTVPEAWAAMYNGKKVSWLLQLVI